MPNRSDRLGSVQRTEGTLADPDPRPMPPPGSSRGERPHLRMLAPWGRGQVTIFVRTPRFLEDLLADELTALGTIRTRVRPGGVQVDGDLRLAYRICLHSRLASRVLWPLAAFPAADDQALYKGIAAIPWPDLIRKNATLAIGFDGHSSTLRHSGFAVQRIKDAIVDRMRSAHGERPGIDREQPDVRLQAVLHRDRVTLYLDLAGSPLHRRGWRSEGGEAPLKENLAAALLLRGGWREGRSDWLLDPFCGSGTLLVEGAWIAAGIPPGLLRKHFGFFAWSGHDPGLFSALLEEIQGRQYGSVRLLGRDQDPEQVERTRRHLLAAGWGRWFQGEVVLEVARLSRFSPSRGEEKSMGLIATNPPYGQRMQQGGLLRELGQVVRREFPGTRLALIVGLPAGVSASQKAQEGILRQIGAADWQSYPCRNGALDAWMFCGTIPSDSEGLLREDRPGSELENTPEGLHSSLTRPLSATVLQSAQMFANRLQKNTRHFARWAGREGTDAYRVYDRDLPEYALIIDRYGDDFCVQEMAAPGSIDPEKAADRRDAALRMLLSTQGIPEERIHFRLRRRQQPQTQYTRLTPLHPQPPAQKRATDFPGNPSKTAHAGLSSVADNEPALAPDERIVREGKARFLVNLNDYLDTGLYLDSRAVRRMISRLFLELSAQKKSRRRFLNLYAYTGTASVQAVLAGADEVVHVDLSRRYLAWAEKNFLLNGLDPAQHQLLRADVWTWLQQSEAQSALFDVILLDPPTFSNSTGLVEDFDVQRDHPKILDIAFRLLRSGGTLIFLNHSRRFRLEWSPPDNALIQEITAQTLDPDCARGRPAHRCWQIRRSH